MSLRLIRTEGHLWLFAHQKIPRCFVVVPGNEDLDCMPGLVVAPHTLELRVYRLGADWYGRRVEDDLHGWLHRRIGNACRGEANRKRNRKGEAPTFSEWLRDESLDGELGCYDLPAIDIDEAWFDTDEQVLTAFVELKRDGERMDDFQACLIGWLRAQGATFDLGREVSR